MVAALTNAMRFPSVALRYRDILGAFVVRDLKVRYEGSLLGRLWPLLHPLLLLGVYSLVFAQMLKQRFAAAGAEVAVGEGWVTTFFMLSGILPWVCTVEGLNRCTNVVIENSNLIKKVAFPSELLPTYTALVSFVQMLIGFALFLPLYVAVTLWFPGEAAAAAGESAGAAAGLAASPAGAAERASMLGNLIWLPLPIVLQLVFVVGLGMLFAALNVFVRDLGQVIPLATLIWMFFTPVFYKLEALSQAPPWVVSAMRWNPMYHLLALYRASFAYEKGTSFPLESLAIFAAVAAGVFLLGHGCFQRWKGHFADEV